MIYYQIFSKSFVRKIWC